MVTVQPNLFGDEPTIEPKLGDNQRAVLDAIQAQSYLHEDEAGAIIHARRGHHSTDVRCDYCGRDGHQVLVSLRNHGLVRQVRASRAWLPAAARTAADVGGPGDLPEDY